jgi:hypothetical protein
MFLETSASCLRLANCRYLTSAKLEWRPATPSKENQGTPPKETTLNRADYLSGESCSEPNGVCRIWKGSPLRQFSETQASSHYVAYSGPLLTGYAGSYVCEPCERPTAGVYLSTETHKWLCGGCKKKVRRPGGPQ